MKDQRLEFLLHQSQQASLSPDEIEELRTLMQRDQIDTEQK